MLESRPLQKQARNAVSMTSDSHYSSPRPKAEYQDPGHLGEDLLERSKAGQMAYTRAGSAERLYHAR